ncbi:MAG TPA: hypothetical protein VLA89_13120 [Gemmatimonadales bacterium]|nr:hypothetical protein [Gemmatimonadales bacterium]
MKKRFSIATFCVITFFMSVGMCALIVTATQAQARKAPAPMTNMRPITNKSAPIDVQRHFSEGKEFSQFPATAVQMRDGTCYAYTNGTSWLAMECFGSVQQ